MSVTLALRIAILMPYIAAVARPERLQEVLGLGCGVVCAVDIEIRPNRSALRLSAPRSLDKARTVRLAVVCMSALM
jgi:hypothetical protein